MKKMTKGAIAAGAAALLLVGGGGTFMSWNDEVTLDQAIAAGNLELDAAEGIWTLNTPENVVTENMETLQIVPGDTLFFTQEIDYAAQGENIAATLTLAEGAIAPATEDLADAALAEQLQDEAVISLEDLPENVTGTGNGPYAFTGGANGTLTATATIEFPFGDEDTSNNSSRLGKVNFAGMALSFTQNEAA